MERLRGMDLQRMVERHGPLPLARVVFLLKQACLSLSEAHALGLVHRDIKPANLFVCRLGSQHDFLKVLDFGVVSRQGPDSVAPITLAGVILGTPGFLAPELLTGNGVFDRRADIYALGGVAYWLLTGRRPYDGSDLNAVLAKQWDTPPRPPSSSSTQPLPAGTDDLVLECLSKDPSARPATVEEFAGRLDGLHLTESWNEWRARDWWEQHAAECLRP
jgi:serine/threonine-protein kinase